ncbi:MAG: MetQ/NlpA family ABC transporter substrate-binding protein [Anaerolineales bacterium]|jgi:NitT/TauT family transport system substrate-binding protein
MKRWIVLTLAAALAFLTGCTGEPEQTDRVRVALLPILDALPIHVAQSEGYFEEQGVQVEIIPVASAPERDQLIQSGQADAMINELVSVIFYNQQSREVVAVRFARTATADAPVFRIVASRASGIQSVEDLVGVPIGISEGTVIEYTTDRLLEEAGLTPDQIEKLAVPKIPDRLNLLSSGQLAAANLPDPAASVAMLQGGQLIIDDSSFPEVGHSVITFDADFVGQNPDTVRAFLVAVEQAVAAINSDKDRWDDLLLEENLLPPPLMGTYILPDYPTASVPTSAQFEDALQWALDKNLVTEQISYDGSVSSEYLP